MVPVKDHFRFSTKLTNRSRSSLGREQLNALETLSVEKAGKEKKNYKNCKDFVTSTLEYCLIYY